MCFIDWTVRFRWRSIFIDGILVYLQISPLNPTPTRDVIEIWPFRDGVRLSLKQKKTCIAMFNNDTLMYMENQK